MENWHFIHFLSHLPGPLSFLQLKKTTTFYPTILSVLWEAEAPPPHCGRPFGIKDISVYLIDITSFKTETLDNDRSGLIKKNRAIFAFLTSIPIEKSLSQISKNINFVEFLSKFFRCF